jgi:hypothetical protein
MARCDAKALFGVRFLIAVLRAEWPKIRQRAAFGCACVNFLIGRMTDDDLPTISIDHGNPVRAQFDSHVANRTFDVRPLVSRPAGSGLNRAEIRPGSRRLSRL